MLLLFGPTAFVETTAPNSLVHDTEHVAEADALFIDQYKHKARLSALLAVFTKRVQEAEDALYDVYVKRLIDNATGIDLDTIGRIVGQPRIGTDDDAYRIFIRTRIRANRSRGKPDDIIAIMTLALNGVQRFEYQETYPASFIVDVLDPLPDFAQFIDDIITSAKPAGVGWSLHFSPSTALDDTFAFSDTDVEQDDDARGFSHGDEDAPGGSLIGAI